MPEEPRSSRRPTGAATVETLQKATETVERCLKQALRTLPGLDDPQPLRQVLAPAFAPLPLADRLRIVEQALTLFRGYYVNLPLKESMHGVRPVRRLELLHHDLQRQQRAGRRGVGSRREQLPSPLDFHRQLTEIFMSVRDRHMRYLLPRPFRNRWALLGFEVESFFALDGSDPGVLEESRLGTPLENLAPGSGFEVIDEIPLEPLAEASAESGPGVDEDPVVGEICLGTGRRASRPRLQRRYLVTRILEGFEHETFGPGVEVTSWNGVPIARAVELSGDRHAGSNPAARHARGLTRLTVRPLWISPPPDEEWVIVGYRRPEDKADTERFLKLAWWVVSLERKSPLPSRRLVDETDVADEIRLGPPRFPEPEVVEEVHLGSGALETSLDESVDTESDAIQFLREALLIHKPVYPEGFPLGVQTRMPHAVKEGVIHGGYGYLRLYTFRVEAGPFVEEVARLVQQMQEVHGIRGLIVDVRDNGGGAIPAGEGLLQLLTSCPIEPERFEFLQTLEAFDFCRRVPFLAPWRDSLELGSRIGARYSRGLSITPPQVANELGPVFDGPVALIVNALSYSTTDVLTAGFKDHRIGPILSTDDNVGAGGANTASHQELLGLSAPGLVPLPGGAGMRVALRRALRVGEQAGTPLEELGVEPDARHFLTRHDHLEQNRDLLARAIGLLEEEARRRKVEAEAQERRAVYPQELHSGPQIRFRGRLLASPGGETYDGPWRPPSPSNPPICRLDLRPDPFAGLYFFVRSLAEGAESGPVPTGFEGAVAAARRLEAGMGGRWSRFDPFGTGAEADAGESSPWARLDDDALRNSHPKSFAETVLDTSARGIDLHLEQAFIHQLRAAEPRFIAGFWPDHQRLLAQAAEELRGSLRRGEVETILASLGRLRPGLTVPVYVVARAPAPGFLLFQRGSEGLDGCVVSADPASGAPLPRNLLSALRTLLAALKARPTPRPPEPGPFS